MHPKIICATITISNSIKTQLGQFLFLIYASQLLNLSGCAHAVEDAEEEAKNNIKPITVIAELSTPLQDAKAIPNATLRANLILDNGEAKAMTFNGNAASWQSTDLARDVPYNISVQFNIEFNDFPG